MNTAELFPLLDALDRLAVLITSDRNLTARAFGILLLGKRFEDKEEEEFVDPTDLLLRGDVVVPRR